MNDYKAEDLRQDTKQFVSSQLGSHILTTIEEMMRGELSAATDMSAIYPERHLARYSALEEVLDFIRQPLDDDTSPRG